MVFCKTANRASTVAERLALDVCGGGAVHEGRRSGATPGHLRFVCLAKINVLVCTDLAARGLDLPEVKRVVQYDFATDAVSHLHRVGRAARRRRRC